MRTGNTDRPDYPNPFAPTAASAAALAAALTIVAVADTAAARDQILGTSSAGVASAAVSGVMKPSVKAVVSPSLVYTGAQYGTAGVALRNRIAAGINISGVVKPVKAAFVYWAYLYTNAPPATQNLKITRYLPPGGTATNVVGTLLGTGADPCWGSDGIAVYRASVPLGVAVGDGSYGITLSAAQSGLNTGEDPWDGNVVFPAAEGASLVIVGTGPYTVELYDTVIPAATTFLNAVYNYTLTLPAVATGASTLWDTIGADGQLGASRAASITGKPTTINGVAVSGIGGADTDSDWDGSAGLPLPQLWDDSGHDITAATPKGTAKLNISITDNNDCISTVANVVAVQ